MWGCRVCFIDYKGVCVSVCVLVCVHNFLCALKMLPYVRKVRGRFHVNNWCLCFLFVCLFACLTTYVRTCMRSRVWCIPLLAWLWECMNIIMYARTPCNSATCRIPLFVTFNSDFSPFKILHIQCSFVEMPTNVQCLFFTNTIIFLGYFTPVETQQQQQRFHYV